MRKQLRTPEIRRNAVAQNIAHKDSLTSQEIWYRIRYLDPDIQPIHPSPQPSERDPIVVALFLAVGICVIALALYLSAA